MTTKYNGNPGNVTTPLTATVIGTASGTGGVVVIQTSAPHLFSSYDQVYVASVGGTTEANGTWSILVIDATHFSLTGSTWANAWTSGGTCQDNSLTPTDTLPSNGEPPNADVLASAFQNCLDKIQKLATDYHIRQGQTLKVELAGLIDVESGPSQDGLVIGSASLMRLRGTLNVASGGAQNFLNGSFLTCNSGSIAAFQGFTQINGATCTIEDNFLPSFQTPQVIDKVQPLVVMSANPFTASTLNGFVFQDSAGAHIYDILITRFINGASIASFTVNYETTGLAPTSADATVTLYRIDYSTTPPTLGSALGTYTVPTGLANLTAYTATVTLGTPSQSREDRWQHILRVVSSTTQPLYWHAPKIHITNIVNLGQY